MELTPIAAGLNALFYDADRALLALCHRLAEAAGR